MSVALFKQIEELNASMQHGWCSLNKANALAAAVLALRPKVVIELGVWGGASLLPMALALKSVGNGMVIGIDPWSAKASIEGQDAINADWWKNVADHDLVHDYFTGMVHILAVQNSVNVQRLRSDEFNPVPCQICHLDANHGPQAIIDILRYAPSITVGGLLFVDDLGWATGDVATAVENLPGLGFVELYRVVNDNRPKPDQWACFQKVRE